MKTTRGLKQRLARVSRLWDKEDYDAALVEVETLLDAWPGNPHLHVLKACLVQLQENPKYELSEAKQLLQRAVDLDQDSPAAPIELGHFLDNVEDDPRAAVKAYADGVAAARHLLIDGLIGQAKALRQLDKGEEFFRCLHELLHLIRFDVDTEHNPTSGLAGDVIIQSSSGQVSVVQAKGPYAEQVQDLLGELVTGRSTPPPAAPVRGRKHGSGK